MYAIDFAKRTRKSSGLQDSESDTDANIPAKQLVTPPCKPTVWLSDVPNLANSTNAHFIEQRAKLLSTVGLLFMGTGIGFRTTISCPIEFVTATSDQYNRRHPNKLMPTRSQYAFKRYNCTLGCQQKSRGLGLPFTTQKIGTLINSRLGSSSTEERLKDLIMAFLEEDGNSCLIIQDEWGLTSGIAVQSAAQTEVFKRWGENLGLDWTHNTNNLGYYLGKQKVAQLCVAVLTLNAVATTSCREPDCYRANWQGCVYSGNEVCEESDDIRYSVATLDYDSVDDDPDEETTPYKQTSIRSDGLLKDLEHSEFMTEEMVWLVENPSQVTQDEFHFLEAPQQALDGSVPSVSCVGVPAGSKPAPLTSVKLSEATHTTRQNSPITASSGSLIQPSMLLAQVPTPEVAQLAACDTQKKQLKVGLHLIKLHPQRRATSTSRVTTQKQARRGTVNLRSDCPIDVESLLLWVQHFPDKDRVLEIIDRYPRLFIEPFIMKRRPEVEMRQPKKNAEIFGA
ncbi:unnamed protein product [Phytophthora fragariaefolia]|uniref:Unnamed protein product n=1 Tax=Phytophthora fragariaefolia TaxID=1490495 RepID=A0A9W6YPL5_9STRA|nr:unnamed protein product [Phytophthora fragariaefolia]